MGTTKQESPAHHEYAEGGASFGPVCVSRIVVATDFSPLSDRAVAFAMSLAAQVQASLTICHVCEPMPATLDPSGAMVQAAVNSEEILNAARASVARDIDRYSISTGKIAGIVREGDPVSEIVNIAHEVGADLIVMGAHQRGTISNLFLSSETQGVMSQTTVPVLVIQESKAA